MGPEADPSQQLHRIERARRVVSLISQATIRAYDEEALLAEACRLMVDVGGYCIAWVGESAPGDVALVPLAHAGSEPSGIRSTRPPWAQDSGARSPTTRAIREQRPRVVRGIPLDPALAARHPDAAALGYASVGAFPLHFGPYGSGALAVYAREPDAFGPEEAALLRELAGDVAVGIAVLRARRANEALEESLEAAEARYRRLVEEAPVAVLQIDVEARQLLVANAALARLLGYASSTELVAQPLAALERHVDAEDLPRVLSALQAGPPYTPIELRLHRKDGRRVWVEAQARLANGPGSGSGPGSGTESRTESSTESGSGSGTESGPGTVEAFVRDLTPSRAVNLADSRLGAVVDASEEAIIGIDPQGVVQIWSRGSTALYGHERAEAVGRPLVDLFVPQERRAEWEGLMARIRAGERVPRFETVRRCKEGELKEVSIAASPILDPDGQVVGASLLSHDVGERKRAEAVRAAQERQAREVAYLQELDRMRSEFIDRASHELNTPLTPILLQVQALKGSPRLGASETLALATIERNVLRLASLVKDLLSASNVNTRRLLLHPAPVDLAELVAHAVESFRPQARQQGVDLSAEAQGPVAAFADGDRVIQVLFNLIGNALKFTKAGSVRVEAFEWPDAAVVTVADTGVGFSGEQGAGLFQPFGRLDEDLPGMPTGTGLGLFISKGIIEESGGTVWAESPGRGQGFTIGFTLPKEPPSWPALAPGRGIARAEGSEGAEAGTKAGQAAGPVAPAPPLQPAPPVQDAAGRTRSR